MKKTEKQEERKAAPEVRINGQRYRLRFDLWALEKIEEEFGGMKEAFQALHGGSMVTTARKMFAIMANCQRNLDGMPEDVTGQEITAHMSVTKLAEISAALRAAVEKGMESETEGGAADDGVHDALEAEYNEKNA